MLSTVIKIGKIYREAGVLEKHRYIVPCPTDTDKSKIVCINIPVNEDMEFDLNSVSFEKNENDKSLFYLNFKTSEADSLKKYVFGDILRTKSKDKEDGNYRLGDKTNKAAAFQRDSFDRANEDSKKFFEGTLIEKFRNSFKEHKSSIHDLTEKQLKDGNGSVIIHFVFPDGKHWYELENEMSQINKALLSSFTKKTEHGLALDAFLYKTLGGIPPGLLSDYNYKTKLFADTDQVMDLFYAVDVSKKAAYSVGDIKIVVLPIGDNLTSDHLDDFFKRDLETIEQDKLEQAEGSINADNTNVSAEDEDDGLFLGCDSKDELKSITQFDIIFSKRGTSASAPDVDVIEISGISKSFLSEISKRVRNIKRDVEAERKEELDSPKLKLNPLSISHSFKNILGDLTKGQKKYQSHLLKVLPKIYTGTYFDDPILLPAFIERVEFNIRNDKQPNYNFLKYYFFYLTKIQNGMEDQDKIKLLKDSKSYQAGLLLGSLARPLNQKIASFEKNYVGLLSRRISDLRGMIKLKDFIDEKLAIHDVAYRNLKEDSKKLAELVKELDPREYRKEECAFGFFESYYSFHKKENNEETENA